MAVTVLALAFLVLVVFIAVVGYKAFVRKSGDLTDDPNTERCSICRQRFNKQELIERQVGDYRLLYFCRNCVMGLYTDLGMKN
jgi:hypothetical protein